MTLVVVLLLVGMALSAFFSGTETGFYRLNRARLLIRALDGDLTSRGLWWLVNNPSVFVATSLVGNNVANFLASAGVVLATGLLAQNSATLEFLLPLLFTPILFIYCELLPKNVFLAAPNRLLHRFAPLFAVAVVLFAPVSILLWLVNRLLQLFGRNWPEDLGLVLARRELGELFEEGGAVGLLCPSQQALAQGTLTLSATPVGNYAMPVSHYPPLGRFASPKDALRLARLFQRRYLPVEEEKGGVRSIVGYVRVADCLLETTGELPVLPLIDISERQPLLTAMTQMQSGDVAFARVINRRKHPLGYVTLPRLREALLTV